MAKLTLALFLFSITIISGCAGRPNPPMLTADQIFSNKAETWTFQNGYGDITTVEVIPVDANHTTWHYGKTVTRAYWAPGVPQAEIWFDLERDAEGNWFSTGGVMNMPQGGPNPNFPDPVIMTRYPVPQDAGQPRPYLILPARTGFAYQAVFADTLPIGTNKLIAVPGTVWKTSSYVEFVDTPVYSGLAYVSDQWEGQCVHEKWWLAPSIGMVKVLPIDEGFCTGTDPKLAMVRIN